MPPSGPLSLQDVDPVEDLLSRLRLDHAARSRGAVIVEGPTDARVLSAVLAQDRVFFPIGGRENVCRSAQALEGEPLTGVVCVADRDFEEDDQMWVHMWWLVFYDDADVEAMLVYSPALDRFLEEWASQQKLAAAGGTAGVRELLAERAKPISALRTANARSGLGLPLDSLDLKEIAVKKDATLRVNSLVGRLVNASSASHSDIEQALEVEPPTCTHTNRLLVRGRDLIAILGVLLRQVIGSLSKQQVEHGFVERSLRLASGRDDFDGTPFQARFNAAMQRATA